MRNLLAVALLGLAVPAMAADFSNTHLSLYGAGGKSTTNWHGQSDLQSLSFDVTQPALTRWRIDVGMIASVHSLWQPKSWFGDRYGDGSETVWATSVALVARHEFARRGAFEPYAEVSSGPMYSDKNLPANTGRINFISQGGGGVIIHRGRIPIIAGLRIGHISNAGLFQHNPGVNFTSIVLGLRFR